MGPALPRKCSWWAIRAAGSLCEASLSNGGKEHILSHEASLSSVKEYVLSHMPGGKLCRGRGAVSEYLGPLRDSAVCLALGLRSCAAIMLA